MPLLQQREDGHSQAVRSPPPLAAPGARPAPHRLTRVRRWCRDFENETGKVRCETCEASYETRITSLSDPIDVYSDWIDACEATKQAAAA